MADAANATYTGLSDLSLAEITISRGVTPACGRIELLAKPVLAPAIGTLEFNHGVNSGTFPDCLPVPGHLRRRKINQHYYWSLSVWDRRWKWWMAEPVTLDYNRRGPDGVIDTAGANKKTARELAAILLDELGEVGYDVTGVPNTVWPRLHCREVPPALVLAELCEYCACAVCGGEAAASVRIVALGTGADLPAGGSPGFLGHQHFRITAPTKPSAVTVRCGPTVYQSKLRLEAVGQDSATIPLVDDLSYKPTPWESESPFSFNSVTDATNRARTFASVWRRFRVKEQVQGGLAVPGSAATIVDVTQYLLTASLVENLADLQGWDKAAAAYIEGKWWPYRDKTESYSAVTRYHGPWTLQPERQSVEFPHPVFGLNQSGVIQPPVMALVCGYHVQGFATQRLDAVEETVIIAGGNGRTLYLSRPEIFATIKANYNAADAVTGTTDTLAQAVLEANAYANRFATALADADQEDVEWDGLETGVELTGKIAQYQLKTSLIEGIFKTRASRGFEFDKFTIAQQERRRHEILAYLRSIEAQR